MKHSKTLLVFFLSSMICSLGVFNSTPINARPCGSSIFSKVGCALDPTNPTDNGGVIFNREQIDKAKKKMRETGRQIDKKVTQPIIVRPIVKTVDWLSKPAEQWGEAGRTGMYIAKAKIASDNLMVEGESIPDMFKPALRQKYGDIVDRVKIKYKANLLNNMCIFQNSICIDLGNTQAQTFGDTIYIKSEKPAPEYKDYETPVVDGKYSIVPNILHWDRFFLSLLAHELKHVQQYRDAGSTGRFGYEYFKSFKEVNQSYENINKEVEAREFAAEYLNYKCTVEVNPRCEAPTSR
jgi:hypothetical protein